MGRNNQQRRADKKRRRDRSNRGGGPSRDRSAAALAVIELSVTAGAVAAYEGDQEARDASCALLAELAEQGAPVTAVAEDLLGAVLASIWEGGWQPQEAVRQVRRRGRDAHVSLLVAALASAACWQDAGGAPMPEPWSAQLDALGAPPARDRDDGWLDVALSAAVPDTAGPASAGALRVCVELLGELMHLPVIEPLLPRPREWRDVAVLGGPGHAEDPVLVKVRALLAKAESTQFGAEAEALTAKAQELMSRHAIDEAIAAAAGAPGEKPTIRRLAVDDPYAEAKSDLLAVIAQANHVRCVWYGRYAMMAVIGFARDIEAVDLLFTSLLVQASKGMLTHGSVTDHRGRSRTRSFRQSFLVAYADRICERLEMAAWQARRDAEREIDASLLPVLAARDHEVEETAARAFPHVHHIKGASATNEQGWRAGRTAAELATLGPVQEVLEGMAATA